MKKSIIITIIFISIFAIALTSCASNEPNQEERITIKVGATPVPHAEILEQVKPVLEEKGITLADGDLDYNFFQHVPYLESFAAEHQLDIIGGVKIHAEPMALYSNSIASLDELKDGATLAIPNDPTNGGRALLLLEQNGLIELEEDAGLEATDKDILSNPKNLKFSLLEAAQLPRVIDDVDAAAINSNYALEADLNPTEDAIVIEEANNSPYQNLIAVRKGKETSEVTKVFEKALTSGTIKEFIETQYQGAIIPAF